MLSSWKCVHCDLFNPSKRMECQACFNKQTKASALDQIMHEQQLLFDGFMRTEILNQISNKLSNIVATDVINVCHQFFELNIFTLMNEIQIEDRMASALGFDYKESAILEKLATKLYHKNEFFVGYKLLTFLLKQDKKYRASWTNTINSRLHNKLGCLLHRWLQLDAAKHEFMISMELLPDSCVYRYNFASILMEIGDHESALTEFQKVIQQQPSYSLAYPELGTCYGILHDFAKASECFMKAIEMEPNNARYHSEYGLFLCRSMEDFDNARIYLEKAIELDENESYAYYGLGGMYRDYFKDYEQAEKYFLKCIAIDDKLIRLINGEYAYLLHLMGERERSKMYIDIQMKMINQNIDQVRVWTYFYFGLINREKRDECLIKAVEFTKSEYTQVIARMRVQRKNDKINDEYYEKFQELLQNKFRKQNKM